MTTFISSSSADDFLNPDDARSRQMALNILHQAIKDDVANLKGWGNVATNSRRDTGYIGFLVKTGEKPAVTTSVINKVVQAVASQGWKVKTLSPTLIIMGAADVKTQVELNFAPPEDLLFTLRFI